MSIDRARRITEREARSHYRSHDRTAAKIDASEYLNGLPKVGWSMMTQAEEQHLMG